MRDDYKNIIKKDSEGEDTDDLVDNKPSKNERIIYEWIAAENETANFDSVRFGVGRGGVEIWFAGEENPSKNELYWTDKEVTVREGEFLIVRFAGAHDGDRLSVYVLGHKETLKAVKQWVGA